MRIDSHTITGMNANGQQKPGILILTPAGPVSATGLATFKVEQDATHGYPAIDGAGSFAPVASVSRQLASKASRMNKATVKLVCPVAGVNVKTGLPAILANSTIMVTFMTHESLTHDQRVQVWDLFETLVRPVIFGDSGAESPASTPITAALIDLDPLY